MMPCLQRIEFKTCLAMCATSFLDGHIVVSVGGGFPKYLLEHALTPQNREECARPTWPGGK